MTKLDMSSLSLATLNVCNYCAPPNSFYDFESCYSNTQWLKKQNWLKQRIESVSADIICLQEVFSIEPLTLLLHSLGYYFIEYSELPTQSDNTPYLFTSPIVVIASRFKLTSLALLPDTLSRKSPFSRQVVKCLVHHPEFGEIRCYGLHLKSKRPADINQEVITSSLISQHIGRLISDRQRSDEALALYTEFILEQDRHPLPTFILGDFNQQTINSQLSFLTELNEEKDMLNGELLLCDSFYVSQQQIRSATHYYQGQGSILDYILCPLSILSELNLSHLEYHIDDKDLCQDEINTKSDHAIVSITLS